MKTRVRVRNIAFLLIVLCGLTHFAVSGEEKANPFGRLIIPNGSATGITIFFPPASGDSGQQLTEAQKLAEKGIVSLLYEPPYRKSSEGGVADPSGEVDLWEKAFQEAPNVLAALAGDFPGVAKNLAVVGKNLGGAVAIFSMRAAGRCFVASGSIPIASEFWTTSPYPGAVEAREGLSQDQLKQFANLTNRFDLIETLGAVNTSRVLIQFGSNDPWIDKEESDALIARYKKHFSFSSFDDNHNMNSTPAVAERLDFIAECLKVRRSFELTGDMS